ncbi:MAG: hypothetical protein VXW59_06735 [Actinomycetota bacterium]|nr:hypothetical protein [Actinomycetota bacterium]
MNETHLPDWDNEMVVLRLDATVRARRANIVVKAALFVSFAIALTADLDTLDGKAMGLRAPLFLASAVIVPLFSWRRRWRPHAHVGDALLALPFLLDTLGNLLGFYDEYPKTDDVLHALNWVLLVLAFHAFRFRNTGHTRDAVFLGYGFGATAIIWWEAMEWAVSKDGWGGAGGLALTYEDTIGDLILSSTGGLIGSLLGVWWRGRKAPPENDAV